MKLVFFGSPGEAAGVLRVLVEAGHNIVLAVTRPDRPAGRTKTPLPTPVREAADARRLPIATPGSLRGEGFIRQLSVLDAAAFVVAAYGRILPPSLLELPPLGVLNVHPSLLPRRRGPSPVQTAILEGDAHTGVTIMLLDRGTDTGPVLARSAPVAIEPDDTGGTLTQRLFEIGAALLSETLPKWRDGAIQPQRQDDSLATVTHLLARADGALPWESGADRLSRMVRAYDPWPGTHTTWCRRTLKVLEARPAAAVEGPHGTVTARDGRLIVATGDGLSLELGRIQIEGRRAVSASEFLRGFGEIDGERLPS